MSTIRILTKPQEAEFRAWLPGHTYRECAAKMQELSGREISTRQVKSWLSNHHVRPFPEGLGQFRKGGVSWNKGKKQSEVIKDPEALARSRATQFRKGHVPHNHVKVGTIVVSTIGYYAIKIAEPDRWKFLHYKLWEDAHGPVPEGMVICFKDNDRLNCTLENLMLCTKSEVASIKPVHLLGDRELTEAYLGVVRLEKAIERRTR